MRTVWGVGSTQATGDCWVYTCAYALTVCRNSFGAQWIELQEQGLLYSVFYRNNEVTVVRGIIIHVMGFFPFGLS